MDVYKRDTSCPIDVAPDTVFLMCALATNISNTLDGVATYTHPVPASQGITR